GVLGAASAGVVIDVGQPPELPRFNSELIQVDLQLRPGHSGGPLVDTQGRLVGINTMISGPEVGLAIPVHVVKTFLRQALASPDLTFV
ncbi:MAG: trypsin-like peptidase domain-containing protein, partial [Anaerolineae bacterium]|nr:trypsin-like peptidase domain-containing protein [Anaerolineae bacterium]